MRREASLIPVNVVNSGCAERLPCPLYSPRVERKGEKEVQLPVIPGYSRFIEKRRFRRPWAQGGRGL